MFLTVLSNTFINIYPNIINTIFISLSSFFCEPYHHSVLILPNKLTPLFDIQNHIKPLKVVTMTTKHPKIIHFLLQVVAISVSTWLSTFAYCRIIVALLSPLVTPPLRHHFNHLENVITWLLRLSSNLRCPCLLIVEMRSFPVNLFRLSRSKPYCHSCYA